jgi:death-on-curing protein
VKKTTIFLSLHEVFELHSELLKRFGGSGGIRDTGLLESALSRPRSGYYESLSLQAAALLQSLVLNHCFIDGNKRVGFASCAIFLRLNGFRIKVSANKAEDFLIEKVIKGKCDLIEIAKWLEKHMTAVK